MNIKKSKDGTVKFDFDQGYAGVLIPLGEKKTLCLSSQIGCPMGCKFCFSGKRKFEKNLSFEELKEQLTVAIDHLEIEDLNCRENKKGKGFLADKISAIVFMGMGEPLLNLDNVLEFCDYVNEFYGYAYSRILISTCGVIPKMNEVIDNVNKIQLAVSLHSLDQEVRDRIMPGVSQYKISDLIDVCKKYNENYRQKIMIEYLMIGGLTDRDEDLSRLIGLGLEKRTNFNLIPLNSSFELDGEKYESSSKERMKYFRDELMKVGFKCFTRTSMGEDIEAACGMLR